MNKIFVMAVFILALAAPAVGEEEIKTVDGKVTGVNWVASTIAVRWIQPRGFSSGFDEICIFVPQGAEIYRGTKLIAMSDITLSDPVTVYYYDAGLGPLTAVKIMDKNSGNR